MQQQFPWYKPGVVYSMMGKLSPFFSIYITFFVGLIWNIRNCKELACNVKPETILEWFRRLVAKKFDGSKNRKKVGRSRIDHQLESLIIQFAAENPSWGYDRIVGALSNLGFDVSDQTVGKILKKNGILPVPNRTQETTGSKFIKNHQDVIAACDFFTTEVITPVGLITYYKQWQAT